MREYPNINHLWANLLIEELVRSGVGMFCLSPGSRCTPLTLAADANPRAQTIVHYDERGAAFFALGYARARNRPAALICTSGTAVANYLPAVIEASQSCVPLILLTADRPPELIDTGANQAIRQRGIFGSYVRWEFGMPCPDQSVPASAVLTTASHAVQSAIGPPSGPVHINCPYREPLEPVPSGEDFGPYLNEVKSWLEGEAPQTAFAGHEWAFSSSEEIRVRALLQEDSKKCILVGKLDHRLEREAAVRLAESVGWPVLPDVTSGLRIGSAHGMMIPHYDVLLHSERWQETFRPDAVLHLGGAMTSKRLMKHLEAHPPKTYIRVSEAPFRDDPIHRVSLRINASVKLFCDRLLAPVEPRQGEGSSKEHQALAGLASIVGEAPAGLEWARYLKESAVAAAGVIDDYLAGMDKLTEPGVARIISKECYHGDALYLGNSMPIRDMDMVGSGAGPSVTVYANRGASGIDGTIATACGIAHGMKRVVTALIGDTAALHDLNSLDLMRKTGAPVVLVVVNNDGGGIFHFLPMGKMAGEDSVLREAFERCFAAPHGIRFEWAAAMFGLRYANPGTIPAFSEAYSDALKAGMSTLIEVQTDRQTNVEVHERLMDQVKDAVDALRDTS